MLANEHVKIYSGNKLIVTGNYWISIVGKCQVCGDVNKLKDDRHCAGCLEEMER